MLGALGRNLPIKITSLVLATLLWAMVAGQREVIRTLRVALDLPPLNGVQAVRWIIAPHHPSVTA